MPYPPSGSTDILGQFLAQRLSARLEQTVPVEQRMRARHHRFGRGRGRGRGREGGVIKRICSTSLPTNGRWWVVDRVKLGDGSGTFHPEREQKTNVR